jgi:hypothetical protein
VLRPGALVLQGRASLRRATTPGNLKLFRCVGGSRTYDLASRCARSTHFWRIRTAPRLGSILDARHLPAARSPAAGAPGRPSPLEGHPIRCRPWALADVPATSFL